MSTETDLDRIKALVAEKFEGYVLIVQKDGQVASCYSSSVTALGMTKMVHDDIEYEMQLNREDQFSESRDEGGDE